MSNPLATYRDQILRAAQRVAPHIRQTPLIDIEVALEDRDPRPKFNVQLKLEHLQKAGSFKARGAFNSLLQSSTQAQRGVVAASGGNHGIAVAWAAAELGHAAHIFVPTIASPAKVEALKRLGAQVHQVGDRFAQAFTESQTFAESLGALQIHAYDQPSTVIGQGTVALEWQNQNQQLNSPLPDTILVAVGGGGLIGGIAAWWQGKVNIVAVEPENCPSLHHALAAQQITDVSVSGLAADSLGATRVGQIMFPLAQKFVSQSVLVTDTAIAQAQTWAWRQMRLALEPGGVCALAALTSGAYRPQAGERVGVLICGGNVALNNFPA